MSLLGICLQCVAVDRHVERLSVLVKNHLSRNFRIYLLPAHEFRDDSRLSCGIRRIAFGNCVCWCTFVSPYQDLVCLDHDAALVQECDRVGLEHHGVELHLIAFGNGALKSCGHSLSYVGDGHLGRCVIIVLHICPAFKDRSRRKSSSTGIVDVLVDMAELILSDDLACCGAVGLHEDDLKSRVLAGLHHYVDGELIAVEQERACLGNVDVWHGLSFALVVDVNDLLVCVPVASGHVKSDRNWDEGFDLVSVCVQECDVDSCHADDVAAYSLGYCVLDVFCVHRCDRHCGACGKRSLRCAYGDLHCACQASEGLCRISGLLDCVVHDVLGRRLVRGFIRFDRISRCVLHCFCGLAGLLRGAGQIFGSFCCFGIIGHGRVRSIHRRLLHRQFDQFVIRRARVGRVLKLGLSVASRRVSCDLFCGLFGDLVLCHVVFRICVERRRHVGHCNEHRHKKRKDPFGLSVLL